MLGCGCTRKTEATLKNCPLCKEKCKSLNYMAVRPVVKEDLQKFVCQDQYYICNNEDCDVVFFNEGEEQIFLTRDINLTADFQEVTKKDKGSCGKSCKGCGYGKKG